MSDMFTIIEINAREDGGHGLQSQSGRKECWLEGWIAVPNELRGRVWDCLGYCNLRIENGVLVDVEEVPRPEPPEPPEPQISDEEAVAIITDTLTTSEALNIITGGTT